MAEVAAACLALTRAAVSAAAAYRGRLVAGFLTSFFPLLLMAVWLTVVAGSGPPRGWTSSDFIAYYAAAAALWHLSGQGVIWHWDADLRSGDLSSRLLRPVHPFFQYASNDLGQRLVALAMLAPVIVGVAVVSPHLQYDLTWGRSLLAALAVVLAYGISLIMASLVALLGFWSTQTTNVWMLWWGVGSFASGWIAPLELMPRWLSEMSVWLPFRSTMGFPIELLMGRLSASEVLLGFSVGLGWIAALTGLYVTMWRPAARRHQAVAG